MIKLLLLRHGEEIISTVKEIVEPETEKPLGYHLHKPPRHMEKHPDVNGDSPQEAHDKLKAQMTPEEYAHAHKKAKQAAKVGYAIGEGVNTAKYLGDLPANHCTPKIIEKKVKAMTKDNFGSVVITDKQSKVRGIVTERDLMKKLLFKSMNPKTTKLKDIMTSPVKVADKDDEMVIWLRQMSNERFRHVPVVDIHLIELIARSLAEEGHNILTSGSQGVNAAVIRAVLDINPSLLTVLLPQSLDRQIPEIKDQLERVMHLVEKSENDELPLPLASSLCNQEIITRCDQLICFAFHDSETLLNSCRCAEEMGKVVSLLFFD